MQQLRHDAFIAQLRSLKSQYQEFDVVLESLIQDVEKLKKQATKSALDKMRANK